MERAGTITLDFLKDGDGVTVIEYAMIAGLIALVIIGAVQLIGQELLPGFQKITAAL